MSQYPYNRRGATHAYQRNLQVCASRAKTRECIKTGQACRRDYITYDN